MNRLSLFLILAAVTAHGLTIKGRDEPLETVKRMAEKGHFEYINELAYRYERGIGGVSQDFIEAVRWYCKNKPKEKDATNSSMLKLEKFAESDPEIKDPTEAPTIYCEQKKASKPSLEPFSPLKVSWCSGNDRDIVKDCMWFKQRHDEYGKPLGGAAISEIALAELPPMSRSTDWYLDQAWKFGIYGDSVAPFIWREYQNGLILENPKQRPHEFLEIKIQHLSKTIKRDKNGNFLFQYNEATPDGRMKLQLVVKSKTIKECLERGLKGHYQENTILGTADTALNEKSGLRFNIALVKICYGNK